MLHLVRNDKFADKRNNKSLRSYLNSITPHIMVDILNQHSDLKAMQSYIYDEKTILVRLGDFYEKKEKARSFE